MVLRPPTEDPRKGLRFRDFECNTPEPFTNRIELTRRPVILSPTVGDIHFHILIKTRRRVSGMGGTGSTVGDPGLWTVSTTPHCHRVGGGDKGVGLTK